MPNITHTDSFYASVVKWYDTYMRERIINVLGSLGYISLVLQWLWMCVAVVIPYIASDTSLRTLFIPSKNESTPSAVQSTTPLIPEWLGVIIGAVVVVLGVIMTIYALYTLPRAIGRGGKTVTTKSATYVSHHIPHQKPLPPRKQKQFEWHMTWLIKAVLCIVPAGIVMIPFDLPQSLPHHIVTLTGIIAAACTMLWFLLQYCFARVWHIATSRVW
jgi:hypothetical protein